MSEPYSDAEIDRSQLLIEQVLGLAPAKPVRRLEKNRTHQVYKLKNGDRVPGASTIAKIGSDPSALLNWAWECGCQGLDFRKVRETAADIGTITHFRVECFFLGAEPDLSEFSPADQAASLITFQKFLTWWEGEGLSVIEPEAQLVSEKYRYGGTIDAPCHDREGRLVCLDWKTAKAIWDEHIIQLAGYENLLNEDFAPRRVERRAILRFGKKERGDFEVRWLSEMDRYWEVFQAQLQLYQARRALR